MQIREYVDDYTKYYPEKWNWSLKNDLNQHDLYMRTRARRSSKYMDGKNNDLLPDFYSIERDAAQFELDHIEWTDFFGLVWEGKKGIISYVGAPNYQGNLYYYHPDDCYADEAGYCISEEYDAFNNQPPSEVYTRIESRGVGHWVDTKNVKEVEYKYIVDNHLFKDTYIEFSYEDGAHLIVHSNYKEIIDAFMKHGKVDLVNIIFKSMNEHFIKLRDSEREEIREFYPGKTAEEMFLGGDEE